AGSLANPARPAYAVRGVYAEEMVTPIAEAMREIGYKRAFVMHGRSRDDRSGMDELSTLGRSCVAELTEDGAIRSYSIKAEDLGAGAADESSLLYKSDRDAEAIRLLQVLSGDDRGCRRDIVCLNAAPILCITDRARDLKDGMQKAADIIDSGRPVKKLRAWVAEQNRDAGLPLERLEQMIALAGN
ncbi:MAG: anthranilate phosphoribosyltransferase, partial [Methanothrix sp.]|nr:anthranilate phosphoribosyltransferase [Methanothrix sp.]